MGQTGEMMLTYRATNALLTNSGCGVVLTVFWELGDAGRTRVASKNRAVFQKLGFLCTLNKSSQEDLALKSKLRPAKFLYNLYNFSLEIRVNFERP